MRHVFVTILVDTTQTRPHLACADAHEEDATSEHVHVHCHWKCMCVVTLTSFDRVARFSEGRIEDVSSAGKWRGRILISRIITRCADSFRWRCVRERRGGSELGVSVGGRGQGALIQRP